MAQHVWTYYCYSDRTLGHLRYSLQLAVLVVVLVVLVAWPPALLKS